MKCKDCGHTVEQPSAVVSKSGDGEPTEYTYYVFCSKCGHEEHLDSELSVKEKENAIKKAERSFWWDFS